MNSEDEVDGDIEKAKAALIEFAKALARRQARLDYETELKRQAILRRGCKSA